VVLTTAGVWSSTLSNFPKLSHRDSCRATLIIFVTGRPSNEHLYDQACWVDVNGHGPAQGSRRVTWPAQLAQFHGSQRGQDRAADVALVGLPCGDVELGDFHVPGQQLGNREAECCCPAVACSSRRLRAAHPNAIMIHTPVHASWPNQVEIFFSIIQKKVVSPNDFASLDQLSGTLLAFADRYNQTARPFNWKYTAAGLARLLDQITAHENPAGLPQAA